MSGAFSYAETLELLGLASAPAVAPSGRSRLFFNTATGQLEASNAGGAYTAIGTGVGSVALHDATHNPFLLYQFQNSLVDTSGSALNLSLIGGTERYTDIFPGVRGFLFDGVTSLTAANSSVYRITGDLTIEMLLLLMNYSTSPQTLVSCQEAGETEAANALYNLGLPDAGNVNLGWLTESGAGVNSTHVINHKPAFSLCHLAVTRVSDVIQFYLNGSALGAASAALLTPTGGTTSIFRVGNNSGGTFPPPISGMASLKLCATGLSAAQILAEARLTIGGAYAI